MSTDVDRPHRFLGGPWDGQTRNYPRAIVPQHCRPHHETETHKGATFAAADAWLGQHRYVPERWDGDIVVMVWRHATFGEIQQAGLDRAERYADKHDDDQEGV